MWSWLIKALHLQGIFPTEPGEIPVEIQGNVTPGSEGKFDIVLIGFIVPL